MLSKESFEKLITKHAPFGSFTKIEGKEEGVCYFINNYTNRLIVFQINSDKRLIDKYGYKEPLSKDKVELLKKDKSLGPEDIGMNRERNIIIFYNAFDQCIALYANGYLTEYGYDSIGICRTETRYPNAVLPNDDLNELKSIASDQQLTYDIGGNYYNTTPTLSYK